MAPRGRPPGSPNRTTREMKERAAFYGDTALEKIAELMEDPDPRVRMDACKTLLDRGFGKPAQTTIVQGDEDGGPVQLSKIERVIVDPKD